MTRPPSPSRRQFLDLAARGSLGAVVLPSLGVVGAMPRPAPVPPSSRTPDESYWRQVKAQFAIRDGLVPMNAANLCPAPLGVIDATTKAARDLDGDVSFQNRAKFGKALDDVRSRLARYLGAFDDEIAIVRNTSEANNAVVGGVPLKAGDEVLLFDQNHPTNNVAWDVRAARFGFSVKRVKLPAVPATADEIVAAFRTALTRSTRVLSFSDVSNVTGVRLPTRALCQMARERGIHAHVDGAQTFGALRRDLHDLGCDSYAASAHKWFMGPKEAGVLYVRRERAAELWPGIVGVGWGANAVTALAGARRFETLGQRNDATIVGFAAALDFHDAVGSARIEARVEELGTALCAGLTKIPGASVVTPAQPELRAGICIARFEGADHRKLYETLYADHGIAGAATGGLRLSPHIYNTMADIERAIGAVRRILAGG